MIRLIVETIPLVSLIFLISSPLRFPAPRGVPGFVLRLICIEKLLVIDPRLLDAASWVALRIASPNKLRVLIKRIIVNSNSDFDHFRVIYAKAFRNIRVLSLFFLFYELFLLQL